MKGSTTKNEIVDFCGKIKLNEQHKNNLFSVNKTLVRSWEEFKLLF